MQTGDNTVFGSYEWRVLDIQGDSVLLITEDIIEQRPYHNQYKDITWANCSLRKYLNEEFYCNFTAAEQARILTVTNKNPDNPWYSSKGGADTKDLIFLLSLEDVACKYFGDSSSKLYSPGKNQRYWFQRKDQNNSKRIAFNKNDEWYHWWWLRSPGRVNLKAVYIHPDGNIGIQGNNILKGNLDEGRCKGGVRPALWIKR